MTPEWFSMFWCSNGKKVRMDTKPESNHDPLSDLLRESRDQPPLASNFHDAVWRRIEGSGASAASMPSPIHWLERWVEMLLMPRFALAGLAMMLVVGGFTGMAASAGAAREQAQARYLSAVAPNSIR
jgi:hypothetical protein